MHMIPVGTVAGHFVRVKRKFALFVGAGFGMVAAGMRRDDPSLPQCCVDHGAPLRLIAGFPHCWIRILHDGEDAGGVGDPCVPLIRIVDGEVTGEPFDKGALFHGRGTRAACLPFRRVRDALNVIG